MFNRRSIRWSVVVASLTRDWLINYCVQIPVQMYSTTYEYVCTIYWIFFWVIKVSLVHFVLSINYSIRGVTIGDRVLLFMWMLLFKCIVDRTICCFDINISISRVISCDVYTFYKINYVVIRVWYTYIPDV